MWRWAWKRPVEDTRTHRHTHTKSWGRQTGGWGGGAVGGGSWATRGLFGWVGVFFKARNAHDRLALESTMSDSISFAFFSTNVQKTLEVSVNQSHFRVNVSFHGNGKVSVRCNNCTEWYLKKRKIWLVKTFLLFTFHKRIPLTYKQSVINMK